MTKIEAIIQTSKLDEVKDALHEVGVEGLTVIEAVMAAKKATRKSIAAANIPWT